MMRVLLVDDDVAASTRLAETLADLGCNVVAFSDGIEGLARAASDYFPLILVAAELPGMNGFRFCNRIKTDPNAKRSQVFLMSSHAALGKFAQHQRLPTHADGYFLTPAELDPLVAQVRVLMASIGDAASGPGFLDEEIVSAETEHDRLFELRARILALDEDGHRLLFELAAAHAHADAQSQEVAGLRRGLDDAASVKEQLDAERQVVDALKGEIIHLDRARATDAEDRASDEQLEQLRSQRQRSELDAAHRESFDLAALAHAAVQDDLHAQLSGARAEVASVQAVTKHALAATNARHVDERAAAKQLGGAAEASLVAERASRADELAGLASARENAGQVAEARLAEMQAKHAELTSTLGHMHRSELTQARDGAAAAIDAGIERTRIVREELTKKLGRTRAESAEALDARDRARAEELSGVRDAHEAAIAKLRGEMLQAEMGSEEGLVDAIGRAYREARSEIEETLTQTRASHAEARQGALEAHAEVQVVLRERAEALAESEERRLRDLAGASAAKQEVEWLLGVERDARAVAEVGRGRAVSEVATLTQGRDDAARQLAVERAAREVDLAASGRAHTSEIARARADARADQDAMVLRAAQAGARVRVEEIQSKLKAETESRTRQIAEVTQAHAVAVAAVEAASCTALVDARAIHVRAEQALEARLRAELEPRPRVLEALLASRSEKIEGLIAERESALSEVSSLEAEIAVLRTELTTLRTKLASEAMLARAATEQLESQRGLFERAKKHLAKPEIV